MRVRAKPGPIWKSCGSEASILVYASVASPSAVRYSDCCAHRIRRVVNADQRIYDIAPRTESGQAPG